MKFAELRKHIMSLASLPESETPIISAYFDLNLPPEAIRDSFARWKEQAERTFEGSSRIDFDMASCRIQQWLYTNSESGRSVALFARAGEIPYFLPIVFQVPLAEFFQADRVPAIYPLVELKDRFNRFVVVLTNRDTARIIEMNLGETSIEMLAEKSEIRGRAGREWTKQHYIRKSRELDNRFLKEKIGILEQIMSKRGHNAIVIAGEGKYVHRLKNALPKNLQNKVVDLLRTGLNDERIPGVLQDAIDLYLKAESRESASTVEQLLAVFRSSRLATLGVEDTITAIKNGQADQIVISAELDHSQREKIVRLASRQGIPIETVSTPGLLDEQGRVGAFLRYRLDSSDFSPLSQVA